MASAAISPAGRPGIGAPRRDEPAGRISVYTSTSGAIQRVSRGSRGILAEAGKTLRHSSGSGCFGGDSETSLGLLKDRIRQFCEARDWDQFHGAKDLAIGIITEAGELLEHFRFRPEAEVDALFSKPGSRAEIESEIADVLIFVLRLAQRYDVDLVRAVQAKLSCNAERYPIEPSRGSNRKARRGQP